MTSASEPAPGSVPLLRVQNLGMVYQTGRGALELFRDLSFSVAKGEMLAIAGESGSGKSTLLHLLGALDTPSAGEIFVGATQLSRLSPRARSDFRNREIGYVWQSHDLLPEFTAEENVAMPLLARGDAREAALREARHWLNEVELADRLEHRSGELSGGEQQRVCLARALVTRPALLLADEPTGNLDSRTAEVIFGILQDLHGHHGMTTVLVTHHAGFASRCDRVLMLRNGALVDGAQRT